MTEDKKRGILIRCFILQNISWCSYGLNSLTATKFNISRQGVQKHLNLLIEEGSIKKIGKGRSTHYIKL